MGSGMVGAGVGPGSTIGAGATRRAEAIGPSSSMSGNEGDVPAQGCGRTAPTTEARSVPHD
jgi:hypothetical protein